jgi:hypothetical protein
MASFQGAALVSSTEADAWFMARKQEEDQSIKGRHGR